MTVVSVAELQRAWRAVEAGQFTTMAHGTRTPRQGTSAADTSSAWSPGAPVLPVLGCHGAAGATTVAVAVASAVEQPVRLVEAAPPGCSGLTGCATAELGQSPSGWVRGRRDQLLLDRLAEGYASPEQVPLPDPEQAPHPDREATTGVNLLDVGWPVGTILDAGGWVRAAVLDADRLVLVTTATVPGLRRLEDVLHQLDPEPGSVVVAVRGPSQRRWPRQVASCVGPRTAALLPGSVVEVPHDLGLAVRGLDTSPLPVGVLAATATITQLLGLTSSASHPKGSTRHVR